MWINQLTMHTILIKYSIKEVPHINYLKETPTHTKQQQQQMQVVGVADTAFILYKYAPLKLLTTENHEQNITDLLLTIH